MNNNENAVQLLSEGLQQLTINLDPQPFMQYLVLLDKWNQAYNLTAVRGIDSMVTRHLLDSLAILPWVTGSQVLDVGSGAGLPGIPLALAMPEVRFILLDSIGKKTRFMQEAKRVLKLDNVEIQQSRVENYHPETGFDTVISRAFSDLRQMVSWTKHLLNQQGTWLAMKGRYPESELDAINHPYQVKTYNVPGIDEERCCVLIENVA